MDISNLYEVLLNKFKKEGASVDVVIHRFSLGLADVKTGKYAHEYGEAETIELLLVPRAANVTLVPLGLYVRYDAAGYTKELLHEEDYVVNHNDVFYKVVDVKPHYFGDILVFYEVGLTHLPYTPIQEEEGE